MEEESYAPTENTDRGALPKHVVQQIQKGRAQRQEETDTPCEPGASQPNNRSLFSPSQTKTKSRTHADGETMFSPSGKHVSVGKWAMAKGSKRARSQHRIRPRNRYVRCRVKDK